MAIDTASPIPLLDLTVPRSEEELAQVVAAAVSSVGFLHVKLDGLSDLNQTRVNEMFSIHKELYDSPLEERAACPADETRNGYQSLGGMRLGEKGGGADAKEAFVYGHRRPDELITSQPLPPALKKNQETVQAFHESCHEALCQLLDSFSLAMKLDKGFFRKAMSPGTNSISLINYPPQPIAKAEETSRAGAHKDWGAITLLFQELNGTPGLEIFLPDEDYTAATEGKPYVLTKDTDLSKGTWHPAPIIPNTVLVNVGLALETWTNGLFKATLHRVVFPASSDPTSSGFAGRRSIAFFSQPKHDVVFNPIAPDGTITVTPGALTSKEFFIERMRAAAY